MPCDSIAREEMEKRARERQIKALEDALKNKSAQITTVGNHASIRGWTERGGWCDECAIRRLKMSADFEVRNIVAKALPIGLGVAGMTFGHGHDHGHSHSHTH